MNLDQRPITTLSRIGGHLCLDFVNTVGGRESILSDQILDYKIFGEMINDYFDLLAWSKVTGLLSESEVQELFIESQKQENLENLKIITAQAINLREVIYRICKAIISKKAPRLLDLDILNQTLTIAYSHTYLVFEGEMFSWKWVNNSLDKMLWLIADLAAELFTKENLSRLRECSGSNCCWLFEDTSKNKARQWCDMQTCGNLAKVRRFRAKLNKTSKPKL